MSKNIKKRTFIIAIILLLIILSTNPGLIPFLPTNIKVQILKSLNSLFGDAAQISQVIMINWITVFQLIFMILAVIVLRDIVDFILNNIKPKKRRVKTLVGLYINVSKYLFTIIAIIWALNIIGISSGTIFAGVSIITMVVSFSADSLIADIITGVFLLFDNIYNVDDIIEINGYRGTVSKIGIRTTNIRDSGGNILIINNSDVRNIINRSNIESKAICDVEVPHKYNIEKIDKSVMEAMNSIKSKYPLIKEPRYKGIQSICKDVIVVRLEATVNENVLYDAQRLMNREIKLAFQNNGIEYGQ
jgi:small conductance mechanosensitive channel